MTREVRVRRHFRFWGKKPAPRLGATPLSASLPVVLPRSELETEFDIDSPALRPMSEAASRSLDERIGALIDDIRELGTIKIDPEFVQQLEDEDRAMDALVGLELQMHDIEAQDRAARDEAEYQRLMREARMTIPPDELVKYQVILDRLQSERDEEARTLDDIDRAIHEYRAAVGTGVPEDELRSQREAIVDRMRKHDLVVNKIRFKRLAEE